MAERKTIARSYTSRCPLGSLAHFEERPNDVRIVPTPDQVHCNKISLLLDEIVGRLPEAAVETLAQALLPF
jgi:hypothetical protein